MDAIKFMFFEYLDWVTSWWWITFAVLAVVGHLTFLLYVESRESICESIKFSVVGFISLIPLIGRMIPHETRYCFDWYWLQLRMSVSFWFFTLQVCVVAMLLGPVGLLINILVWVIDYVYRTAFGHDILRYGFVKAVELRLKRKF